MQGRPIMHGSLCRCTESATYLKACYALEYLLFTVYILYPVYTDSVLSALWLAGWFIELLKSLMPL